MEIEPKNRDVLKLLADATSLAKSPRGKPQRWIIDFNNMSLEDASNSDRPFILLFYSAASLKVVYIPSRRN